MRYAPHEVGAETTQAHAPYAFIRRGVEREVKKDDVIPNFVQEVTHIACLGQGVPWLAVAIMVVIMNLLP